MPSRLSPGDTKLLWTAASFGAVLIVATLFLSPAVQRGESPVPSSYSSDPDGALAAYLLLSDLKIPVRRSEQAPDSLRDAPADSVLILAEPTELANTVERKELLEFVKRGGRILFCGGRLAAFLPLPETRSIFAASWEPYRAEFPSGLTRGADTVILRATARGDLSGPASLRLYGKQDIPVVVVSQIGQGEVLWWSAATPLTNVGISQVDNVHLFLNAVSNADGTPRPVYWDEYFHGQRGSLWTYVARTPLPWGLWQMALVSAVLLFAFSRRSGPIVMPQARSRLSPLEFVNTMGDLYDRAGATSIAVEIPYKRLRLQLARKLGRNSTASDAELARAASERLSLPETEILATLQQAAQAVRTPKLPGKRALDLVQKLVRYSRQLSMPQLSQEKKT